ncbi:hypothetical protein DFJ63DRAFT_313156 [Scheffersomyces coipomensis]|uniref:uncharacterized protein n=1 Tax=Scheffersomyces coipomensis TaxID=1788519 RepID=UPI00315DCE0B
MSGKEQGSSSTTSSQVNLNNHSAQITSAKGNDSASDPKDNNDNDPKSKDKVNPNLNSGSYIDHRQYNDLAHLHSSPARARRRSSQQQLYTQGQGNIVKPSRRQTDISDHSDDFVRTPLARKSTLPLTNRNLQNLLTQSNGNNSTQDPQQQQQHQQQHHHQPSILNQNSRVNNNNGPIIGSSSNGKFGSVALDMEEYTKEQRRLASSQSWNTDHYDDTFHRDDSDKYSLNSMEFGGSNPSSDHSSDSTSLDDVCFPDYYDHIASINNKENTYQWPDIKVLEEFVREEIDNETQELQRMTTPPSPPLVNFHHPIRNPVSESISPLERNSPKPTEGTPLLDNYHIDEIASLSSVQESFRVRPTPIQPWEKSKEQIPTILNRPYQSPHKKYNSKTGKMDGKLCRYTYFRENLDKTIHSPSISGLLVDEADSYEERIENQKKLWENNNNDNILNMDDIEDNLEDEELEEDEEEKSIFDKLQMLFQPSHYSSPLSSFPSSTSVGNIVSPSVTNTNNVAPSIMTTGIALSTSNGNNTPHVPSSLHVSNIVEPINVSSSNLPGSINLRVGQSSKGTDTPVVGTIGSVSEELSNVSPFWLDVLDPTEEEMKVLSKTFGIHPLTTEDIFLGETREKVELFKTYYFICFTSFDVVYERRKARKKEHEKKFSKLQEMYDNASDDNSIFGSQERKSAIWSFFSNLVGKKSSKPRSREPSLMHPPTKDSSYKSRGKKIREGELSPLNMYMIVFKDAVITFHFSATPHPINVRRRARLLREYLNVTSDWISYALIDDITDSFAPMIESIEEEVNAIEDAILKMHSGEDSDTDDSDSDDSDVEEKLHKPPLHQSMRRTKRAAEVQDTSNNVFIWRKRSKSTVDHNVGAGFKKLASESSSSSKKSSASTSSKILGWKRKGDMLRRIGECRKRVMSVLRLLGSKADVIKGFSKRFSEAMAESNKTPKAEIGMYLGDIQDHIVTMVQSLNHYEKLLARFHSNYLAQINIDMTKVNNDTNDVLGKITILGTIVLPINVVTGLWGMNCVVPGQEYDGLEWFWGIVGAMLLFSFLAFNYARKVTGL